jgi:hypothetical protein
MKQTSTLTGLTTTQITVLAEAGQLDHYDAVEYYKGYKAHAQGDPIDYNWGPARAAGYNQACRDDSGPRQIHCWNTGRPYCEHGQRMAACRIDGQRIAFVDIDRGISGIVADDPGKFIATTVMAKYDGGDYDIGLPKFLRHKLTVVAETA